MRNPARTASTAAALMIGLALITFVAVLGAGPQDGSFTERGRRAVRRRLRRDGRQRTAGPHVQGRRRRARDRRAPGVEAAPRSAPATAKVFGKTVATVNGVDPNDDEGLRLRPGSEGSDNVPRVARRRRRVRQATFADDHDLARSGSPFSTVRRPTGKKLRLHVVRGIFEPPEGRLAVRRGVDLAAGLRRALRRGRQPVHARRHDEGVNAADTGARASSLAAFPDAEVETARASSRTSQRRRDLDMILNILYVLLALSVIVSLFGMVNTLVLSVFERTRELGMLRAIGMTRRQTRRMIRHESIVTALIGAALGIAVGIFLAVLTTPRCRSTAIVFAVPVAGTTRRVFVGRRDPGRRCWPRIPSTPLGEGRAHPRGAGPVRGRVPARGVAALARAGGHAHPKREAGRPRRGGTGRQLGAARRRLDCRRLAHGLNRNGGYSSVTRRNAYPSTRFPQRVTPTTNSNSPRG